MNTAQEPLEIRYVPIGWLKDYAGNAKVHTDEQLAVLARSIERFGFGAPVLAEADGTIIAGHGRRAAAQRLGMLTVPAVVLEHLSNEDARALRLADNRIAELANWDDELLARELMALHELQVDFDGLGWNEQEIADLFADQRAADGGDVLEQPAPEPADAAVTVAGDLWVLGGHRLLCGDSSKWADVERLLDGAKIHLVNTDPPYNVKVEPRSNNAIRSGLSSFKEQTHHQALDLARHPSKSKPTTKKMRAKDRPLANDFVTDEAFDQLLLDWFGNMARALIEGGGFYIWGGYANCANYPPALKASELYFSQAVIWVKEHPVLTRKDFMGNHEWCFYGWKEGAAHRWFGPTNAVDTWLIKKVNPQSMVHLTEKPVELASRAIEYSSQAGENVLDLFGGSGSTLMACEKHTRHAFLMELDVQYCDVIIRRWQNATGGKAILVSSGASYADTAAARGVEVGSN